MPNFEYEMTLCASTDRLIFTAYALLAHESSSGRSAERDELQPVRCNKFPKSVKLNSETEYLFARDGVQGAPGDDEEVGVVNPHIAALLPGKAVHKDVLKKQVGQLHGLLIEAGGGRPVHGIAAAVDIGGVGGAVKVVHWHGPFADCFGVQPGGI